MGLPINFNPYAPIPNNPFFYQQTNSLSSITGPLVVGTGFTINYTTGVISVSGGGGGGSSATPTVEGIVYGLTEPISGGTFNVGLGEAALASVTGTANTAVGTGAGGVLAAGGFNTYIGAGAGAADTSGNNNIALGFNTLNAFDGGSLNVALGYLAGSALTNETGNVILGGAAGLPGFNDHIYLASGSGTLRVLINDNGAIAFDGSDFGTPGQILTSLGTASQPQWVTGASGTFTAGANTITVTNGIITSIV